MVCVRKSYSSKHFLLKALCYFNIFPMVTTRLLTGPGIYPQILKLLILNYNSLLYLFVRGSSKQQRKGAITKWETLFISHNNQALLRIISLCSPLLTPFINGLPLLSNSDKKRRYLDTHLREELTDLFWRLLGCSLFPMAE